MDSYSTNPVCSGTLHHVELYVSDLQKSIEFWGWLLESLGYQKFQEWKTGRDWKLGDTYIVFVQAEKRYQDIPYHRKRVGLNHLAFHVKSKDDLRRFARELKRRGVHILYQNRSVPTQSDTAIYFEDPDRMKVELVSPP